MSLVTVLDCRDVADGELAVLRLESDGIPARLEDVHLIALHWTWSQALGGVKVRVHERHLDAARESLAADRAGELHEVAERLAPPSDGDRCPACASPRVRGSRVQRVSAALCLLSSLPLVAWRRRWVCEVCGLSWRKAPSGMQADRDPAEVRLAEQLVYERHRHPITRVYIASLLAVVILGYVEMQIRGAS